MDTVESTSSLWKLEIPERRESLDQDVDADVCIVGAGIAGLSTAYHLTREGRRVVVLDAHDIAAGQTAQTTAHLASALDDRFSELERVHGRHGARLAYESHAQAIDEIEATIKRESIHCDFRRLAGFLFLGPGQDEKLLSDELEAAQRAGFSGATLVARAPVASFDTGPCILFPNQARFHPLRYLSGLASAVERAGGTIYARTRATEVHGGERPHVMTADGFEVRAKSIVVATNSPVHLRVAMHAKQAPYRTYVVVLRVPTAIVPDALYWDACDPYHYVRLELDSAGLDYLIVGGEDVRTAEDDDAQERYDRLERWARERFPVVGNAVHRWSGQVLEPFDHLAFIGKDPSRQPNVYVATGDSGHGITHGALAGMLLSDLIAGRPNPWEKIYDPSRISVRAAGEYARGGVAMVKDYAQWLMPERRRSSELPAPGEGVVIQRGPRKIALYCDAQGAMHERSAVCTHLGGVVRWNSDAKSWDCGCHGSRFAPTGEVLNGPANRPLMRVDSDTEWRRSVRSLVRGGLAGAVATLAMTAALAVPKATGALGEFPPKKLMRRMRRRVGVRGVSRSGDAVLTVLGHWGFGMAVGSLFGLLHRKQRGLAQSSLLGAGYGLAVWAASYAGFIPALGLMRPPHRDKPGRPTSMVAGHLVFGSVLGAVVDRAAESRGTHAA
jgi:glycine/D-amino acid oxidase-like deaminating enzyme/nitrite reductase/ring-hydroxylating ferredoxin subunit